MQVPAWVLLLFLSTFIALTWHEMATSILSLGLSLNRAVSIFPTSMRAFNPSRTFTSIKTSPLLHSVYNRIRPLTTQRQTHTYTSTTASKSSNMASKAFLDTVKERRTIYALKKESTISDKQIQDIIEQAILHVPSSFNSQSSRAVLLLKGEHEKLWDITTEVLKGVVPADAFASTEQKLQGFKAAYGTVLFYTHRPTISSFQEQYALYADKFPTWATQSDGMHQYVVWSAFAAEGLGANLQHYNPLIDAKVAEKWGIDKDWELTSQLVFGTPAGAAGDKEFKDVSERFKTFGA